MRPYEMGDPDLDQQIKELVAAAGDGENADLVAEMITTALKLQRDAADRGDMKLINTSLKEMRYSMLVFSKYRHRPKVTMFGSARTTPGEPNYQLAAEFARSMVVDRQWMVVTGAGPGVMQAGNEGAGPEASIGVNIRLPFESDANPFIPDSRLINFKYFFTRKLGFVKESHAFALFPGGFGTMDETFELLTLVQTGKSDLRPIVLLEADGTGYWKTWRRFVEQDLLGNGLISEADLNLFKITTDVEEAADEICNFYANYHSQRYVEGRLVLRLRQAPDREQLARLNEQFADIVVDGAIEVIPPTPAEVSTQDALDLDRVILTFNRRDLGRLRLLVNELNGMVTAPPPSELHPPPPEVP